MKQKHVDYQVIPNPKVRRFMAAAFRSDRHTPIIHGLLEVDVSKARAHLREQKAQTGEALSFTAFLIACLAKAADEHKAVQARHQGSKRLVLFEEVDVYTLIEHEVAGQKLGMNHVIRAANRKTVHEIHEEIRADQAQDIENATRWLRFCKGAAWGIPQALPTLMLTVGGIGEKPVLVDGHIALREHLSMTISFAHDVIDGAPAARFTERLKELIESGYGLLDSTIEQEQVGAAFVANKS